MIYIELDHLEDIMAWANAQGTETVYTYSIGGDLAYWRMTISSWRVDTCFTFRINGARLLVELGLVRPYDLGDSRPYEEVPIPLPQDQDAKWRELSKYWRPLAQAKITELDLVTLGMEGTVMTPDQWGRIDQ